MLDLKFVKENREKVKQNVEERGLKVDVDEILDLYEQKNTLLVSIEELRNYRNLSSSLNQSLQITSENLKKAMLPPKNILETFRLNTEKLSEALKTPRVWKTQGESLKPLTKDTESICAKLKHLIQKILEKKDDAEEISKQKLLQSAAESQNLKQELIQDGRTLKGIIAGQEASLEILEAELARKAALLPNMTHPNVPRGKTEADNREIRREGKIPAFDFAPKDHVELGKILDIMDFEKASVVSGPKFYYLKNEGVLLEMSLIMYAMKHLISRGFTPFITPDVAKSSILEGIGFAPRGKESNVYALEDMDLCLVGTAEITLGGFYSDQIVDLSGGPLLMGGLSHCFRKEAGAAGQFSKGLYRVHQFTKVEMFALCQSEESEKIHEELLKIEEELFSKLGIPYRVLDICQGDLGAPAYRKFDLEAWMPSRDEKGGWGEVTSASNCTDFQARRLNIRTKTSQGNTFVHTLNGTAIACPRAFVAILENFQKKDGAVVIPEVLRPYTGFSEIKPKKLEAKGAF